MKWKALVLTDLDGTLLQDNKQVSPRDFTTLQTLGGKNIARVAATGRPLQHVYDVIPEDFPLDYVIFSSGAGIIRWEDQKILHKQSLTAAEVQQVYHVLMKHDVSFVIQGPIPDNHFFHYQINGITTADFLNRCQRYAHYGQPLRPNGNPLDSASQFLVTFPNMGAFNKIAAHIKQLQIIRATSPADFKTIWMEIFPQRVSKGHAAAWLKEHLRITNHATFAVGNDYNDLHMLEWANASYVVANAPEELKRQFKPARASNQEHGFSLAVEDFMRQSRHRL